MKPCRNTFEGNTGSPIKGVSPRLVVAMCSDKDISAMSFRSLCIITSKRWRGSSTCTLLRAIPSGFTRPARSGSMRS